MEQRFSDNDISKRDIPSFIEPRPPLINNPFMRPRPQKGTNLLELFEEDSDIEEPELVQVYLRMKPSEVPNNLYEVRSDKCLVTSLDTTTAGHGRRTQHNVSRMYTFSRIFDAQCSQKEIFDHVVKDNLKKLPDGHSFTLLTYGASGSGKTYTLMGTVNSPGLVPRALEYVFKLVDASQQPTYKPSESGAEKLGNIQQEYELQWVKRLRQVSAPQRDKYRRMSAQLKSDLTVSSIDLTSGTKHYVWVSFVEIYNEAIYDLLAPPDKRTKLRIREDNTGQVYAKGVTQAFVRTGAEAYDIMVAGKHNLVVAATGVHAHSSRSHCIFTITMLTETEGAARAACVRLCDLAGCERARATRNTGARMQESRAINSSLHVLERCLHLLRRNQKQRHDALVPYRESKLTRLLGSGLSGSRGEAVSMVVTLNPSPQYAHETKHVLSLAAVAQDIQINNTVMFASALESSNCTQDTTITSSAEVMKLRADNELLHFELVQAQARNKELLAMIEEKREQSANTMRELVEEAKDMTRQYYEAQIDSLRSEMEDMVEEYEARLAKTAAPAIVSTGTPTRFLQSKIAHLMTDITVLQEKLSAEQLARARAEEELKHTRACIDERDEKAYKENVSEDQEEVVLTDSDDESSDPFNQSLEPVFRKECINRSVIKASIDSQSDKVIMNGSNENEERPVEGDSDVEMSTDTIKQADNDDTPRNSDYETGDESEVKDPELSKMLDSTINSNTIDNDKHSTDLIDKNKESEIEDQLYNESKNATKVSADANKSGVRLFVQDLEQQDNGPNESIEIKNQVRGTYFVRQSALDSSTDKDIENPVDEHESEDSEQNMFSGTYNTRNSTIDTSIDEEIQEFVEHKTVLKDRVTTDIELTNKTEAEQMKPPKPVSETLVSRIINSLKKSTQSNNSDNSLRQFEQLEKAAKDCENDSTDRNTAFGDLKILKEKRTYFDENEKSSAVFHVTPGSKSSETFISSNKTKNSFDEQPVQKENSPEAVSCSNPEINIDLKETKIKPEEVLISKPVLEKRPYFNNIDITTETINNKMVNDLKTSCRKNYERSPSIVSDDSDKPFEPSTMKKLLGENIAKLEVLSSIHTNKPFIKKHDSIDVFEGLDSPQEKPKEVISTNLSTHSNLDDVRKSIEKLVLEQKTRNDNIKEKAGTIKTPVTVKKSENKKESVNIVITGVTATFDETQFKQDNTIEEFENIYKDLSTHRPTEFDLLTSQEVDANENVNVKTEVKIDDKVKDTKSDKNDVKMNDDPEIVETKVEEIKYNLRQKGKSMAKSIHNDSNEKKGKDIEEILLESNSKCESKTKYNKRSLRLRRRKNEEENSDQDSDKLKDIINLKKEFCDVTLGLPAFKKEVKDIPSPEKLPGKDENLPPLLGIQSCPSKSVTRSRRKLFTPRAEPLEESLSQTGDSNERVYVPRPSYHRARARRKL